MNAAQELWRDSRTAGWHSETDYFSRGSLPDKDNSCFHGMRAKHNDAHLHLIATDHTQDLWLLLLDYIKRILPARTHLLVDRRPIIPDAAHLRSWNAYKFHERRTWGSTRTTHTAAFLDVKGRLTSIPHEDSKAIARKALVCLMHAKPFVVAHHWSYATPSNPDLELRVGYFRGISCCTPIPAVVVQA